MRPMYYKSKILIFLIGLSLFFIKSEVFAQQKIYRVDIKGNKRVSTTTILSHIRTRANILFNKKVINEDIKRLYALGYFENIAVEKKDEENGVVVVFNVREKPVLKKMVLKGVRHIGRKKLKEIIPFKEGDFIDDFLIKDTIKKMKELYQEKGFSNVEISYKKDINDKENTVSLELVITEGTRLRVRRIKIEGIKSFPIKKIRKLMKTKPSFLFLKRLFKKNVIRDDIKRIESFYKMEGFNDVKVDYYAKIEGKWVDIFINIEEGKRYYVEKITIEGNKNISGEELRKQLSMKEGDVFSTMKMKLDVSSLQGMYIDRGYIFAQVRPISILNVETGKIDVTYKIIENEVAYVEKVIIRGNVKTKDEVIRRELRIYPGDKFDGERIRKSRQRLENLGFFKEIMFDAQEGSAPNLRNCIVDVKEAKTGYFNLGGGYSSIDEFVGFIELRQRNFDYKNFKTFTGAGQDLFLQASFGTLTERYQLSFTNPWIFDRPISFGFDVYKKGHQQEENVGYGYAETIKGGAIRFGKEFNDYLKGKITYRLEQVEISDVVDEATQDLKDEIGTNDLSSLELGFAYDTRDNVFSPSKGLYFVTSFQLTGGFLGGDKDFNKLYSRLSFYFPLIYKSVLELRLRMGIATTFSDTDKVPIYERFFAGGAYTIRGYQERKVGPIDASSDDPLGGEAMFIGNIEYTYPLADFIKIATFFDTGNVWSKKSDFLSGGFKSSVGVGLRVKTPIGPVRLDYGWPLNLEPGEEKKEGRFHFSISRGF